MSDNQDHTEQLNIARNLLNRPGSGRPKLEQQNRSVRLSDFLTDQQIQKAWDLYEMERGRDPRVFVDRCEREVLNPIKGVIELKLMAECNMRYLAYLIQYVFDMAIEGK